jgi:hypothetical protein
MIIPPIFNHIVLDLSINPPPLHRIEFANAHDRVCWAKAMKSRPQRAPLIVRVRLHDPHAALQIYTRYRQHCSPIANVYFATQTWFDR